MTNGICGRVEMTIVDRDGSGSLANSVDFLLCISNST